MAKGRKTGGRKKGTPNKTTRAVKDALHEAFAEMGGIPALVEWGMDNRGDFYKLWARLIPIEIKGGGVDVRVNIIETVVSSDDASDDHAAGAIAPAAG